MVTYLAMNSESWHARLTMCLNPPTLPIHTNLLSAQPSWPLALPSKCYLPGHEQRVVVRAADHVLGADAQLLG